MTDLDIAKNELYEQNLTLAIVKNSQILYETKTHQITGFLNAIQKCQNQLEGASVADRVVGKAIALLCAYAKTKEVYAAVLGRQAQRILKTHKITCQWNQLVDNILDSTGQSMCPFEKAATNITDPEKAYTTFKDLQKNLKPPEN